MEEQIAESFDQLKNFISTHKLQNKNSLVHFRAKAIITTARVVEQEEDVTIMVSFNVYNSAGRLTFQAHNLNPEFYPTIFYLDYDNFLHINDSYLLITGFHSRNTIIGNYTIKIFPLGKIKD